MHSLKVLATVLVALLALPMAHADDGGQARAVIDKAINAGGGEAALAKFKTQTWNEKGVFSGMGNPVPYAGKYAMEWPNKFRMEIQGFFTMILNGDKGWVVRNGETSAMPKEELEDQQEEQYAGWVGTLLPLGDKRYKLTLLGELKEDDEKVLGVKVSRESHRDVTLYFDKETGLLVKSERRATERAQDNRQVRVQMWYKDYHELDGAKVPMRIIIKHDGKPFVDATIADLKGSVKLDPKLFEKPGDK